ncbi:sulfite exporter TauE/SafE family protein [Filibacter tadaridae]|uniref:Probable membrane transporter protein n=1 Tax=Filibacter tadaridae TaxID=2483811 RepID=A0A3P5WHB8_9BACL|nr:sulfite exporter TauE/SafE family protein [Filibacter tadaridae]VDC21058.1 Sulfite exporter TauE/SafE [Filibacter tadaridae]
MDFAFIITIFLLGFIGSFVSGMVGIGGAIINYPILLYIPPLLGVAAFTAHDVSGISAIQVLFATLSGVWAYRKSGFIHKTLVIYMGSSIIIGSFIGGFGSNMMSEGSVNLIYGILATLAAIMMFIPKKNVDDVPADELKFNKWLAAVLAFIVGVAAGIVGAGGAFILVPIMLLILKIPTRITIATSLAITFISSIGSSIGKIATDQVLYGPAVILIVASVLAAPLGAKTGQKMNTKVLQWILAVLILGTAIKIWLDF